MKSKRVRVLAAMAATIMAVTLLPVTEVQAAGFSGAGFDISSYNGVVDWEQVTEAGMDFVMIRTGEGRAPDVDEQFEANYDGAPGNLCRRQRKHNRDRDGVLRHNCGCGLYTDDLFVCLVSEREF